MLIKFLKKSRPPTDPVVRSHLKIKSRIDLKRDFRELDYVSFDAEMTGLDVKRDSMISIGAVRMSGTRVLPGQTFYRLLRPSTEVHRQGVLIHEIVPSDLESADGPEKVLIDFLEFVGDSVLLGHFVYIDVGFVSAAMKRLFGTRLQSPSVDTSAIHDWLGENDSRFMRHHSGMALKTDLFSLAERYGIEVEKAHNALSDAFVTAQLFQRFAHFLPECGVVTLKDLLSISQS